MNFTQKGFFDKGTLLRWPMSRFTLNSLPVPGDEVCEAWRNCLENKVQGDGSRVALKATSVARKQRGDFQWVTDLRREKLTYMLELVTRGWRSVETIQVGSWSLEAVLSIC